LPSLLRKRGRPDVDVPASLEYLQHFVGSIEPDLYTGYETEARQRLRGCDEDDWPVLAAALGLDCPVWTEDADFFGTGVAVWTTSRIELFPQARAKVHESEDE
jgi:hypothetical protein